MDKACFQDDMAYSDFENLTRSTVSHKVLHDKAFEIANNPQYDGYQRVLASMVYEFFDKGVASVATNQQLSDELDKQIIKKFEMVKYISLLWMTYVVILLIWN